MLKNFQTRIFKLQSLERPEYAPVFARTWFYRTFAHVYMILGGKQEVTPAVVKGVKEALEAFESSNAASAQTSAPVQHPAAPEVFVR